MQRSFDPDQARRHVWLAALQQLALCDGVYAPEEQRLLEEHVARELPDEPPPLLHQPGDGALLQRLGRGSAQAGQFLRTAVMVALADGHLSEPELALLRHWSQLLAVGDVSLAGLRSDLDPTPTPDSVLERLRSWLDGLEPQDPAVARLLVRMIPASCPFERDVVVFGRRLLHIPPMCRINPLYEQLMGLRFRCLQALETGAPSNGEAALSSAADGDGSAARGSDR